MRAPSKASFLAIALGSVLVVLTAYSVFGDVRGRNGIRSVDDAISIAERYDDVGDSLIRLELAATRFLADPGRENRIEFEVEAERTLAILDEIEARGTEADRELLRLVRAEHLPKLDVVRGFFSAIEEGRPFDGELPSDATATELREVFRGPADLRRSEAQGMLESHRAAQELRLQITVAVFALGLAMFAGLLVALRRQERSESRARAEIAQLTSAVRSDGLTGALSHRAFQEDLISIGAGMDEGLEALALAMVDIDEFKLVNESWGHGRGDEVLVELADLLRARCPDGSDVYRLGGDEFALLFAGFSVARAVEAMDAIREDIGALLGGVTISVGVSAMPAASSPLDFEVLKTRAGSALRAAKRRGRNNVVAFDDAIAQDVVTFSSTKVAALRRLLSTGDLRVAFQPIWMLDGSLAAYEALARIPPEYGLDGPQSAFDIADHIGRVPELDSICRDAIVEHSASVPNGALLFMNVAPEALIDPRFSAANLAAAFAERGRSAQSVVIELTERTSAPLGLLQRRFRELRDHGFRLALDDVGAGNSGLELMRSLPHDFIKIDRTVLEAATRDSVGRGVLMALISFAVEASATVIVEGIEDSGSIDLVRRAARFEFRPVDVDIAVQGYLLGRPTERLEAVTPLPLLAQAS